jgi:hypothetical protein
MYALFRDSPNRKLGQTVDPTLAYVRRQYGILINDVQNYYRNAPKYVASNNLFALLIQQFEINMNMSDPEWVMHIERYSRGAIPNMGITSPINKGKIFTKGITLGPQAEEVAVASFEKFRTEGIGKVWRDLRPVRYLYHTRTDMMLPIMNNTTPGRAFGVISINIPMLMVQYRYWHRWQLARGVIQAENVYRFVGSILLPSLIESFLDIAFFNRLDRASQGIPNPVFPSPHPFYITDLSTRLKKIEDSINFEALLKGIEIEGLAAITPMLVKPNLFDVLKLPREPITLQNQWTMTMARLPYVRYLVRMVMRNHGYDASQINAVMIDLIEGSHDQIFNQMGNTEFVKVFRKQITELIDDIKTKKN